MLKGKWFELTRLDAINSIENYQKADADLSSDKSWLLVFMEKGEGVFLYNSKSLSLNSMQYALINPSSVSEFVSLKEASAFFVRFRAEGAAAKPLLQSNSTRLFVPLRGDVPPEPDCLSLIRYLYRQFAASSEDQLFMVTQLTALFHILSRHARASGVTPFKKKNLSEQTLSFIEANLNRALSADDYEEALKHSYHHLNLLFKQSYNQTIKQYQLHARMRHAASLLLSGKNVQETSRLLGYDDYYFFIRCFKKVHGITPGQYVKQPEIP
ncbi:MAG: helix-turn-helix transcriptional regulator [Clostridia bacterium]|nr:helix-turn-helix transcriptional regulator [Clostridia bacterium]